jgi:hypothetical protein
VSMNTCGKITRALLFSCLLPLLAQMPDWKYFRDRQGNTYFIDQAGKIRITDVRRYGYRPVSPSGIDYYLEYAAALVKEHRPIEGISVLKSICALPVDNNRIYQAQVKATELLLDLKKKNGPRYAAMYESASLVLFSRNGATTVINDQMRYSFHAPERIDVVRKSDRSRLEFHYSGIQFGVRVSERGKNQADAYDFLVAVDSEKFSVPFKDLSDAVESWKANIGYEGLVREVLSRGDDRVVYLFRSSDRPGYTGIEGIVINGSYSHYVRIVSSDSGYERNSASMRKIMDGFRTVSGGR